MIRIWHIMRCSNNTKFPLIMALPDSKMLVVLLWMRMTYMIQDISFKIREYEYQDTSVIGTSELFVTVKGGTLSDHGNRQGQYKEAALNENLTKGPIVRAHARVREGRTRRPRKLKKRPELELVDLELSLELILLAMRLLPKLVVIGARMQAE